MGRIRLSIHPLFFVFGLYYALKGEILLFIIYTLTALAHEMGHSIVSAGLGYKLNKITLMPFGAVVSGDIEGLKITDQAKIALAGPLLNILVCALFVSCWWIFPESYAYTDTIVQANASMAIVNLLPSYPLDGGRILSAILASKLGKVKSIKICKIIGGALGASLLALFFVTIFIKINVSLLFFGLFVFFGAVSTEKENVYVCLYTLLSKENLKRGVPYKKQGVDEDITIKKLITLLDSASINEIVVYSNGKPKTTLSQPKIIKIIENSSIYSTLKQNLY